MDGAKYWTLDSVPAAMSFAVPPPDGAKPVSYNYEPPLGVPRRSNLLCDLSSWQVTAFTGLGTLANFYLQ